MRSSEVRVARNVLAVTCAGRRMARASRPWQQRPLGVFRLQALRQKPVTAYELRRVSNARLKERKQSLFDYNVESSIVVT